MTTSDPMSCCDITLTASSTVPLGGVVNRALPLIRRISLTSMSPPSVFARRHCRRSLSVQITPGIAPHATREPSARQSAPLPYCLCQRATVDVLQLTSHRNAPRQPRHLEPPCPEQFADVVR